MCYFALTMFPKSADWLHLQQICTSKNVQLSTISNASLSAQLRDVQIALILIGNEPCHCNSAIGRLNKATSNPSFDLEKEKQKLKRKGWSDSKIERSLAEKLAAHGRSEEKNSLADAAEIEKWVELFSSTAKELPTEEISLLLHVYTGDIEQEEVSIEARHTLTIEGCRSGDLLTVATDELYSLRF